jgi:hypothetical protein
MEAISDTRNSVAKAMEVTSFLDKIAILKTKLSPELDINVNTIAGSHMLE